MHTLLILSLGLILGTRGPIWLATLITYLQNRQLIKEITPTDVVQSRLCKGPHGWMSSKAYTDKGPGTIQLCRVCGLIPSMSKMATPEAIDRIDENNKIDEIESKIYKDFLAQEDGDIKKYFDAEIKNGVEFDKLAHVHGAGMTFGIRYNVYKTARSGEIQEALKKSNA